MITILAEIELILNNRPLTYIFDELTKEPLTPNHLLYGRKLNELEAERLIQTK